MADSVLAQSDKDEAECVVEGSEDHPVDSCVAAASKLEPSSLPSSSSSCAAAQQKSRQTLKVPGVKKVVVPRVDVTFAKSLRAVFTQVVGILNWQIVDDRFVPHNQSAILWHAANNCRNGKYYDFGSGWLNRFPNMHLYARKVALTNLFRRMERLFPDEYDFLPKTWVFPQEMSLIRAEHRSTKSLANGSEKMYIVKPDGGSQGTGIYLAQTPRDILSGNRRHPAVVQEYIASPLLIDGLKFDLRVYVLVTSVSPVPKFYVFREGLARFCTMPYNPPTTKNKSKMYMHLTNYSLNKSSPTYVHVTTDGTQLPKEDEGRGSNSKENQEPRRDDLEEDGNDDTNNTEATDDGEDDEMEGNREAETSMLDEGHLPSDSEGSKRTISSVIARLKSDGKDVSKFWPGIDDVISKTMIAMSPNLALDHQMAMEEPQGRPKCFQVLGFDVLLDSDLKPYLLEINANPSLRLDYEKELSGGQKESVQSAIDEEIKLPLLVETLKLIMTIHNTASPRRPKSAPPDIAGKKKTKKNTKSMKPLRHRNSSLRAKSATKKDTRSNTTLEEPDCDDRISVVVSQPEFLDSPKIGGPNAIFAELGPGVDDTMKPLCVFEKCRVAFNMFSNRKNSAIPSITSPSFRKFVQQANLPSRVFSTSDVDIIYRRALRDRKLSRNRLTFDAFCDCCLQLGEQVNPGAPAKAIGKIMQKVIGTTR